MKKKAIALVLSLTMVMGMSTTVFADTGSGADPVIAGGTDVYAGSVVDEKDTAIFIEVPTMLAFVVKTDGAGTKQTISPNAKVVEGKISYTDSSTATNFVNKSSKKNTAGTAREGLAVKIRGELIEEQGSRWTYDPTVTADAAGKQLFYKVSALGQEFSKRTANGYQMAEQADLDAPGANDTFDNTTKKAVTGTKKLANFVVVTGGTATEYGSEAINSVKVATISWTVSSAE